SLRPCATSSLGSRRRRLRAPRRLNVGTPDRHTTEIGRAEFAENLQSHTVEYGDLVAAHGDQALAPELGDHAIDVWAAQSDHIADRLLGQWHLEGILRGAADRMQPGLHLEQEMGEPFQRVA